MSTTGIYPTPDPHVAVIVAKGDAFLVDTRHPSDYGVIDTKGPVTSIMTLVSEGLLILASPWRATAIGSSGIVWQTARLAIDGVRLDEAVDGRLAGVADPDDDEPRDFVIDLRTGGHEGGFDEPD